MLGFAVPQQGPALPKNSIVSIGPADDFAAASIDDLVEQWEAALFDPPPAAPSQILANGPVLRSSDPLDLALLEPTASAVLGPLAPAACDMKQAACDGLPEPLSLSWDELLTRADALVDELLEDVQARKPAQRAAGDTAHRGSGCSGHRAAPAAGPGSLLPSWRPAGPAVAGATGVRAAQTLPAHPPTPLLLQPLQQFEATVDALVDEELASLLAGSDGAASPPRERRTACGAAAATQHSGYGNRAT